MTDLPWDCPDANPLADIRKIVQDAPASYSQVIARWVNEQWPAERPKHTGPHVHAALSDHDSGHHVVMPDGSRLQLRGPGVRRYHDEPLLFMPWDWRP